MTGGAAPAPAELALEVQLCPGRAAGKPARYDQRPGGALDPQRCSPELAAEQHGLLVQAQLSSWHAAVRDEGIDGKAALDPRSALAELRRASVVEKSGPADVPALQQREQRLRMAVAEKDIELLDLRRQLFSDRQAASPHIAQASDLQDWTHANCWRTGSTDTFSQVLSWTGRNRLGLKGSQAVFCMQTTWLAAVSPAMRVSR